ncbi:MAG: glycosyltransferase family 4 protein [Patescibacteria group bacterium]
MNKKPSFIPHWFKYIDTEKHLKCDKDIFGKTFYKAFINKRMPKKVLNIAAFLDGVFYPTTTGQSYHIMTLLNAFASKGVCPFLFRCYRGWEESKVFEEFAFNTVCIKPTVFYDDLDKVVELVRRYKIDSVIFDTAEVILYQGAYIKDASNIQLIYDVPNIDPVLSRLVGLKQETIDAQIKELTLANKYVDVYWVKSDIDAEYLLNMGFEKRKVKVRGVGIDFSKFNFKERNFFHKPIRAVFVGNLYYPPNKAGLPVLKETKMKCLGRGIDIGIDIVGDGDIDKLSKEFPELNFLGGVANLSVTLSHYDLAFACPMYGSGVSLKVLDYMASGLPVITNSVGVRGHSTQINDCVLLEDADSLYVCVEKIVRDLDLYRRLSRSGYQYVLNNFDIRKKIDCFVADIKMRV